jgi:hypothetical protein
MVLVLVCLFWILFFTIGPWLVLSVKSPLVRFYIWQVSYIEGLKAHIEYLKEHMND